MGERWHQCVNLCLFLQTFCQASWSSGNSSDLCLGSAWFEPWSGDTNYPGRDFYGFPQSLQANSGIVPLIRLPLRLSIFFPIYYLLILPFSTI
jgi:hypothetical protein